MSRILSFSLDEDLADGLEGLVRACGYKNRSRFLRDAVAHYSDAVMRGDIQTMEDDVPVEGTIVLYYQHDAEEHLPEFRHLDGVTMSGSTHACMPGSHTCVDTASLSGNAGLIRKLVDRIRATEGVDRVMFVLAPRREDGCC